MRALPSSLSFKVSISVSSCIKSTTAIEISEFSCERSPKRDGTHWRSTKVGYKSGAVANVRKSKNNQIIVNY